MPGREIDLLAEVAQQGGEIALGYWKQKPRSWEKTAGAGPVSEADLAVDAFLRDTLTAARPDHGWLSEETADGPDRLGRARVFIVDPIDGTRAFLDGSPDFAVSVALAEAGRVVAGVVHLPARGLTYAATAGGPATLNGTPLAIAPGGPEAARASVLTARASLDPVHWRDGRVPPLERHFRSSLAWRLCLVAEGRFDSMLTLRPAWEWDVAAGALIAERAGAEVSDAQGRLVVYNGRPPQAQGLVAARPALHADLLARLRPWPGPPPA